MPFHTQAHKANAGCCIVNPGTKEVPAEKFVELYFPEVTPAVCDFRYVDHGSIIIFTPVTAEAKLFAESHYGLSDAARWGVNSYVVVHRDFANLVDDIDDYGLTFAPGGV